MLTLEQKVGCSPGRLLVATRRTGVGLRRMVVSDGPAGVRGERWDERDTSANCPSPTAMAQPGTSVRRGARRAARCEARRKGVGVLLAPTLNLHRTPYGGRHFECFSEDPLLTARIGDGADPRRPGRRCRRDRQALLSPTIPRPSGRRSMRGIDERTLREVYLAPFEAAVRDGDCGSVMAAYNGVNGQWMTESDMLRDLLERRARVRRAR